MTRPLAEVFRRVGGEDFFGRGRSECFVGPLEERYAAGLWRELEAGRRRPDVTCGDGRRSAPAVACARRGAPG